MADSPLQSDQKTASLILAAAYRKYTGSGGIEVATSADGKAVSIALRARGGQSGDADVGGIYRANSLVSLANSGEFVIWKCRSVAPDGTEGTTEVPIWTRPDVCVDDVILGLSVETGLSFTETANSQTVTTDVHVMQPGADTNSPFKVYLAQNGGSNGNKTTDCTYTYDAYIAATPQNATTKIGSTLSPQWRYLQKCAVTAATVGLACYVNGSIELQIAYESLTSNSCS